MAAIVASDRLDLTGGDQSLHLPGATGPPKAESTSVAALHDIRGESSPPNPEPSLPAADHACSPLAGSQRQELPLIPSRTRGQAASMGVVTWGL